MRTNGVAPGAALLPAGAAPEHEQRLLARIPLQRLGTPQDIAEAVLFLASATYINGQILAVDGGRSLT